MKEAMLYSKEGNKTKCFLCAHHCTIADGKRGVCRVRENKRGVLYSLVYGRVIAAHVDPIGKKPLFHYKPGSDSYSIATIGCNFRCSFCQNWDISQRSKEGDIVGAEMPPDRVVENALENRCESVSYTYTEPTIFFEYAHDTAKIAREHGLGNVFVSNGYMTPESVDAASKFVDADNVDLKSFSDRFYRERCGGSLEPVLETLRGLVKKGVWVEVTTLVIPKINDSGGELTQIAEFIKNELGDHVPWHISRFHPDYKLLDAKPTPLEAIHKAWRIGKDVGLKYVYPGNIPHEETENTNCFNCGEVLIERYGFNVIKKNIKDSKCPACGAKVDGKDL